jgi:hypothetical protein
MAIDHKTITDSEKHTPKGYPDTGSPGTNHVYQYNGSALEFGLVDTGSIASSAVTTAKLDNGSVTNDKVATGTLGAEKLQSGALNGVVAAALGIDVSPGSINLIPAGQPSLETTETTYQSYTYAISNTTRSYSVIIFGIGSVTISFKLRSSNSDRSVNGRVLVNGSQVYAVTLESSSYTTYSFTPIVNSGDVITFQCKEDGGLSSLAYMSGFEINADKYVPTFAGSVVS